MGYVYAYTLLILILYWIVGRCFGAGKSGPGGIKNFQFCRPFLWDTIRSSTLDWALCIVRQGKKEKEEGCGRQVGGGEIVKDVEVKWRVSKLIITDRSRSL